MNSHVVEKKISANNYSREDSPYLISVGRLNRLKGFEQLIKCFARAQFNNPISLIIVGSGALKPDLQALISELGMEERIELLGFHPFPQVFVIQAEALILNSTFECFPNVLTEALSLGVPVISNDCDYGPREIIYDRVNGLLFDQARDENLIKVLEEFVNSKSLKQRLQSNTSEGLNRFTPDRITSEWINKVID